MNQQQAEQIIAVLSTRFGLALGAAVGADSVGPFFEIYPTDVEMSESFKLCVHFGWRHLEASFVPGTFSASLIHAMGKADAEHQLIFRSLAESIIAANGRIAMTINGSEVSPVETLTWPAEWNRLSISIKKSPVEAFTEGLDVAILWTGCFLGMILALVPTEEVADSKFNIWNGAAEGAAYSVQITRYERNTLNRGACIQLKGTRCLVCGFDFGERYGPLGDGYIHVHHVVPVSRLGPDYIVNPARDLVPLCANCHSMAHRTEPPMAVDELRRLIHEASLSAQLRQETWTAPAGQMSPPPGVAK